MGFVRFVLLISMGIPAASWAHSACELALIGVSPELNARAMNDENGALKAYAVSQPQKLKVATWNLNLLYRTGVHTLNYHIRSERMAPTLLEYIENHSPDILLLQEIWSTKDYAKIIGVAVQAGFEPAGGLITGPSHGLQILIRKTSVKAVESAGFSTMNKYGIVPFEWIGKVERGLMWVKIVLPDGQRVLIGNTHLTPFTSYFAVRARQVEIIAELIEQFSFDRDHVVIGGDFNIAADFRAYSERKFAALNKAQWPYSAWISSTGLRDAYRSVHPLLPGYSYNPLFDPLKYSPAIRADQRLDYIFAGERSLDARLHVMAAGIEFEGLHGGILPSDHFMVHATLELFQIPATLLKSRSN